MTPAARVVVIEDEPAIARHVVGGLVAAGYEATWSPTGASGMSSVAAFRPNIVLLDLGLPDADGVDVARRLRAGDPDLVIVMLTARGADIDVIVGLDAGADDYVVKPFTIPTLLARLRANLRTRSGATAPTGRPPLTCGDLVLDVAARVCRLAGSEVPLRAKELDLLAVLLERAGQMVSREDLMALVWDENWFGSTKTLDVTMAALRRALAQGPGRAPTITTLRGRGYRLEAQHADQEDPDRL